MPVHDAADCRAQQCHHHAPPLQERDAPAPANPEATPQLHYGGGRVTGPGELVPFVLHRDHIMTAAEVQAAVPDLHYWRFDPDPDRCEHGATVTRRLDVVQPILGDPDRVKVIGRTVDPVTYCLDCHHLAPTPQEAAQ